MLNLLINAIRDDKSRTTYQIRETGDHQYNVSQYNQLIITANSELSARNAVECMMKDNGWHLEELVRNEGTAWWAVAFEPQENGSVVLRVFEWMGGRYVQLGPDETYSVEAVADLYGYC